MSTLSVLTVVCFVLGFVALIFYLFLIAVLPKKVAFYKGIVLLPLGLIFMIMAGVQSNYLHAQEQGIVFSGAADVKGGPDVKQKTLFVIHAGTRVSISENKGDWIKVTLANGNGGWIKLTDVKVI